MATNEKLNDGVRAVDRALDILMAFSARDYELTASELLSRVKLSRPTLYRLLYTLEQNGFITATGDPQRFRLGPAVAHLSHVWTASLDIGAVAQPIMQRIWETTGETVALFIPQGGHRLCVAELASAQPLSFKRGVGYMEHIARGASGRAILAFLPSAQEKLAEYAADLKTSAAHYADALQEVRERGYAISKDELIDGAVSVSAPFFNGAGKVAGSIGVFGPSVRLDAGRIEEIAALLTAEARNLSRALGHL